MATLADGGRITLAEVAEEIGLLQTNWQEQSSTPDRLILSDVLSEDDIAALDLFDHAQLETVLQVCRESKSLSDAVRKLFAVSRQAQRQANDADPLRKYLAKFGIACPLGVTSHDRRCKANRSAKT